MQSAGCHNRAPCLLGLALTAGQVSYPDAMGVIAKGLDVYPLPCRHACRHEAAHQVLIGYARVSTAGQDLSRQVRALKAERCATIFTDATSGKSLEGGLNSQGRSAISRQATS